MMKFTAAFLALAATALAQNNAINIPAGGLQVTAGQPLTITWSDPSSSTVTIKLQQGSGVTPSSGITLESNIPASAQTATFTIPADEVNASQYNIEIIDDSDESNYNFTPGFVVAGGTCVGTCDGTASTTGSASNTGTATATSTTGSTTATTTGSSASSSASASSASASSSLVSSLKSSASSASKSKSAASATAAATTSAPSAGSAGAIKAQAGLVVAVVAAVAAF